YGDPSTSSLNPCGKGGNHSYPDEHRARQVQKAAIQLDVLASFTGFLPAVIPTIFLGPATDVLGRRIGFVLPVLGTVARSLVFLFVYGTGASVYYMYIGTTLEGLGGGFGSFLMTSFSAAADVTTPGPQRALRICIIEAVNVGASSLAGFISGQWRKSSYEHPVMFCAAFGVVCLAFALWVIPETWHPGQAPPSPDIRREDPRGVQDKGSNIPNNHRGIAQEVTSSSGRQQNECGEAGPGYTDEGFVPCSIQAHASESDFSASREFLESGSSYNSTKKTHANTTLSSPPTTPGAMSPGPIPFQGHGYYVPQSNRPSVDVESCESFVCSNSPRRASRPPLPASQPRSDGGDTHSSCCGTALRGVARSVKVYFRVNPELPARRCVLVLCFTAFILTVAVNFSKPVVETVYRMGELCWNAIKETEFDSGWLIAHWVCILIALHVFQRRLGVPDVYIAMMGCVSGIAAPAVFAFAKNSAIVFVSAACGTMGRALIPMLRSMASAVVDTDEQGALFASFACVELAGAALFGMAFGQLYRVTLDIWTGIVFLVLAGIMVLVFILLM
ncbi:hypothetical protein BaRGS_00034644, partial [Batillaria attramentaria]